MANISAELAAGPICSGDLYYYPQPGVEATWLGKGRSCVQNRITLLSLRLRVHMSITIMCWMLHVATREVSQLHYTHVVLFFSGWNYENTSSSALAPAMQTYCAARPAFAQESCWSIEAIEAIAVIVTNWFGAGSMQGRSACTRAQCTASGRLTR